MNDGQKQSPQKEKILDMIEEVSLLVEDDGTGGIGIIVREALRQDPDVTADEIAEICREAQTDAAAEFERDRLAGEV